MEDGDSGHDRGMGVSRATLYRRRRPKPAAHAAAPPGTRARVKPPRALDDQERRQVLDPLHSVPFADEAAAAKIFQACRKDT
jgi:hypothetical protein